MSDSAATLFHEQICDKPPSIKLDCRMASDGGGGKRKKKACVQISPHVTPDDAEAAGFAKYNSPLCWQLTALQAWYLWIHLPSPLIFTTLLC